MQMWLCWLCVIKIFFKFSMFCFVSLLTRAFHDDKNIYIRLFNELPNWENSLPRGGCGGSIKL